MYCYKRLLILFLIFFVIQETFKKLQYYTIMALATRFIPSKIINLIIYIIDTHRQFFFLLTRKFLVLMKQPTIIFLPWSSDYGKKTFSVIIMTMRISWHSPSSYNPNKYILPAQESLLLLCMFNNLADGRGKFAFVYPPSSPTKYFITKTKIWSFKNRFK